MEGIRKVCINIEDINWAKGYNTQMIMEGQDYKKVHVPPKEYMSARLSFPASTVVDYFIDPESRDRDLIVWLQHRGEIRFEYSPVLETQLETIMSVK